MNLQSLLSAVAPDSALILNNHTPGLDANGSPATENGHTNGYSAEKHPFLDRHSENGSTDTPTPQPTAAALSGSSTNNTHTKESENSKRRNSFYDADLEGVPIDSTYLSQFEQKVNAISKLDKIMTVALNATTLSKEATNLEKLIATRNKYAGNYIARATIENHLFPAIPSEGPFMGSTRINHESTLETERRQKLQQKLDAATAQGMSPSPGIVDVGTRSANKRMSATSETPDQSEIPEEASDAPEIAATKETKTSKRTKTPKKAAAGEDSDAKRRKLDEDAVAQEETPQEKSRRARESRLKIKLLLKEADAKLLEQSSQTSAADAKLNSIKAKELKSITKQYDNTYVAIWKDLLRKDGPKASRLMQLTSQTKLINMKKTAILASRESKRWLMRNNKNQKDLTTKARRAMREMSHFWKRNERQERDARKKQEREQVDKAKKEEEDREARRQSRKLNFLITQTELYSHFISKKIKTSEIEGADADPNLNLTPEANPLDKYHGVEGKTSDIKLLDFDSDNEDDLHRAAAANAQSALDSAKSRAEAFDDDSFKNPDTNGEEMNFQNPTLVGDLTVTQPKMLKCTLKEYQIKGLNWLANLYEQGINGILADEMGLGKTVQSISVLSYLAETHNIWGPFLVVTPASTLHNWQQEITKFVPDMKVLPYWGNTKDRKILRKFWDRQSLRYGKDAPFHVLVTSYQLVVADAAYFLKMKWQYMILDEAQAIKSSQSTRWKSLLGFSCRNRLLLTGTPIQNSMQELWALLHFIMPSLFDSHDEFSDWFSKDIESHAQSNTQLNEQQLKRLHVILKPFMLRRVKKNVQSELGDKLEIDIFCDLTNRQKKYYQMLKSQISLVDLFSNNNNDDNTQSLMNLVMQFRKVCNHPDLFERADVESSFAFGTFAETSSFLRETELEVANSFRNSIRYDVPKLIYNDLLLPSYSNDVGSRNKLLEKFSIYNPENITDDLKGLFAWKSFSGVSSAQIKKLSQQSIIQRAIELKDYSGLNYEDVNRFDFVYGEGPDSYVPREKLLLIRELKNNHCNSTNSETLRGLYFIKEKVYDDMYINVLEPAAKPIAITPPIDFTCSNRAFSTNLDATLYDSRIKESLRPLTRGTELELMKKRVPVTEYPKAEMLPEPLSKFIDYSNIRMPSMNRFITESGKLSRLDKLLDELKKNDHRVLVYFQMTKMMDLMEEFLTFRQHNYIRLDGSSKLEDRRDLVHDWQTKPEIFVFLLSTRAGGLGINLTAADTVIFYDSDWNPTIDSQAMDRAHRLGQTKQVTVYRLLTKGTIEERMRDRAKQKEQVQQVVMEGKANFGKKKDDAASKKKDVAFLLLGGGDEDEQVSTDGTPSGEPISNRLEALYHEGEGEFSENVTPMP